MRVVDVLLPPRLGTPFRWVVGASWLSNLGDGVSLAAGPLLVASLTHEPFVVALAALLQWLPPLVLGLPAGVVVDRVDRRRLLLAVNGVRVAALLTLTAAVATGDVGVGWVLVVLAAAATAEVFADTTSATLLPGLVHRDDLAVAGVRLQAGFLTMNQLAGPPVGALLFGLGAATPFGAQAALLALAVTCTARVRLPPREVGGPRRHPGRDLVEGLRWVAHHRAVRTLVLTIFVFNLTYGAAWGVLVLYVQQRLGLGGAGFGVVTAVGAAGGIVGTLLYGRIAARVALGTLMRVGLVVETLTHLVLALTTSPWVALPVFFVFGVHTFVWGTTSSAVRQRAVPLALQGRVTSVNAVGTYGGLVLGVGVGGLLATHLGVTAPFWYAFAGSALFVLLLWRQLRHVAHADAAPVA